MIHNRFRSKGNKYGRKRVTIDDLTFDSKLEASVYLMLKQEPEIEEIFTQEKVYLTKARILAKVDFRVKTKLGEIYWVEAKGKNLPSWNIKKKLWQHYGPGKLQVWKGTYSKLYLDQTIIPEVQDGQKGTNPK